MTALMENRSLDAIIIGAGPSGIAMAHSLKHKLGFEDFVIYDKLDGPGGTWLTNTYPGCGCDIPTHLYSFSFNLNPEWSKELCDQPEILEYINATVDKFNLRSHMNFQVECLKAEWKNNGAWEVRFLHLKTGKQFVRTSRVLISAVGGISYPRDVQFQGMERFKGEMFHSARWNHKVDYTNQRMAVIGNGCSAAQIIPKVAERAAYVQQYARSPQWYHERPNKNISTFRKLCFKYVPFWQRFHRLQLFLRSDNLVTTYISGDKAAIKRSETEQEAKDYIYSRTPKKYHDFIVPEFPLGCKRRIFDPGYLDGLHRANVELVQQGIQEIDETAVIGSDGDHTDFDIIILATGFQVSKFLTPMEVIGKTGLSLAEQWDQCQGAQAYMGSFVHNFPNFAILFGPNTFPAHNSALFTCEVQVEYVTRALMAPLIDRRASIIEIKESAETRWVNDIDASLQGSVFSAGCTNWYINEFGRNAASWPDSSLWPLHTVKRWLITWGYGKTQWLIFGALLAVLSGKQNFTKEITVPADKVLGRAV
ncbi:monooxygenase [Bisporella sp. PMI_857]|nr:monooxygenase [Bisporella sp. PMI_857]